MGLFWKTNAEQRASIIDRYKRGDPTRSIATDNHVTTSYVRMLAKRNGIPARRGDHRDVIHKEKTES